MHSTIQLMGTIFSRSLVRPTLSACRCNTRLILSSYTTLDEKDLSGMCMHVFKVSWQGRTEQEARGGITQPSFSITVSGPGLEYRKAMSECKLPRVSFNLLRFSFRFWSNSPAVMRWTRFMERRCRRSHQPPETTFIVKSTILWRRSKDGMDDTE